jgi:hypothetical protein
VTTLRRSRQTHTFATRADLVAGLKQAEEQLEIRYYRSDELRFDSQFEQFDSLVGWAELGRNTTGDHTGGHRFLVVHKQTRIKVERIRQTGGGVRYALDQLRNPDSVTFLPGGIYGDNRILVCGHIGTASESDISIVLYKAFTRAVTKGFEKVGAYRVGPEASRLMEQGYRMVTIGVTSPAEYDLRRQ